MTEKITISDSPVVKIQRFSVFIPNKGRFIVERKETTRQQHHMGCTDGMKEGEVDIFVKYKVTQEIPPNLKQEVIKAIQKEIGDE